MTSDELYKVMSLCQNRRNYVPDHVVLTRAYSTHISTKSLTEGRETVVTWSLENWFRISLKPHSAEFARVTEKGEQACCTEHELKLCISDQCTYKGEDTVCSKGGKLSEPTSCPDSCDAASLF